MSVRVGIDLHADIVTADPATRRALVRHAAAAGLDYIGMADHVSFRGGTGFDGLTAATIALSDQDQLPVVVGVYQLALRHPLPVARQLATIAQIAPGRLVLGVGAGGEDRSEAANCGVDPATRGRRLNESLAVLAALADGEPVSYRGEFFQLDRARILPPPGPRIPVVIGGRSAAAAARAGRYGDGWLGIYVSPERFAAMAHQVRLEAQDCGRPEPDWFGLIAWCGFGPDRDSAAAALAERMTGLYRLPFESFSRYCPAGPPVHVAEFLRPYVEAGCGHITLSATGPSPQYAVDAAAEVRQLLLADSRTSGVRPADRARAPGKWPESGPDGAPSPGQDSITYGVGCRPSVSVKP